MRRKTHPWGRGWRAEQGQRMGQPTDATAYAAHRLAQINYLRERRGLEPLTDAEVAIAWERKLRLGK